MKDKKYNLKELEQLFFSSPPFLIRKNIPFYYNKTTQEFRQDPYENYAEMVLRQTRLHLSSQTWEAYPFQAINNWVKEELRTGQPFTSIADIGCGVGRLIGNIAVEFPMVTCYGIDYSYQLLRQASRYWREGRKLDINASQRGFLAEKVEGYELKNVHFALAKGEALPFANQSLEVICSSFALDRFEAPLAALKEMYRVLKSNGKLLLLSPLNFQKMNHWEQLYPTDKLLKQLQVIGFQLVKEVDVLEVKEPLDAHGNAVVWQVVAISLEVLKNKW